MNRIILASASPRRKELLEKHHIPFEVLVTDADETITDNLSPTDYALEVSRRKAEAAVSVLQGQAVTILAADTIVVCNGMIFGKPTDAAEAATMLRKLSGATHTVCTGITIAYLEADSVTYRQDCCSTQVTFYPLSEVDIADYIATGEPFGKAGSYAIQGLGGQFIEGIEGDYENVVGLPVKRVIEMLERG